MRPPMRPTVAHALLVAVLLCAIPALRAHTEADVRTFSSSPKEMVEVSNHLLFSADDGVHGRELWCAPRVGAPFIVGDLEPGPAASNPFQPVKWGRNLVFTATTSAYGLEPWIFDTFTKQVHLLADLNPGADSSSPCLLPLGPDALLVTWISESSSHLALLNPETRQLDNIANLPRAHEISWCLAKSGEIVFSTPRGLCVSNGTPTGTRDFPLSTPGVSRSVQWLTRMGNQVAFISDDVDHGTELWATDAAMATTAMVKDISPGPQASGLGQFESFGDKLIFSANDGTHGRELWISDGTEAGTTLLKDISEGIAASDPHYLLEVGNVLFFAADDGVHGNELWVTDGTTEGTRMVAEINPGPTGADIWSMCPANGQLFFSANSTEKGEEMFAVKLDTLQLRCLDLLPGPAGISPNHITPFDGKLFFAGNVGLCGEELYQIDPSSIEPLVQLSADINYPPQETIPSSNPAHLTPFKDKLLFSASNLEYGNEAWISDGTEAGTRLLGDIAPGSPDSTPSEFTTAGSHAFFAATQSATGRELWVVESEPEIIRMVADIRPGPVDSDPRNLAVNGTSLYFTANNENGKRSLWIIQNEKQGAQMVCDAFPTANGPGTPARIFVCVGQTYFYVRGEDDVVALWKTDGSKKNTKCIHDNVSKLRMDNKTPELRQMALLCQLFPHTKSTPSAPPQLDQWYYFAAQTPRFGAELYRTNLNLTETQLVADLFPGPPSSGPTFITPCGRSVLFIAETARRGRILHQSDGTPERTGYATADLAGFQVIVQPREMAPLPDGTLLVVAPHPALGNLDGVELGRVTLLENGLRYNVISTENTFQVKELHHLTRSGNWVYFVGNMRGYGFELWATDGTPEGTHLVKDILPPSIDKP